MKIVSHSKNYVIQNFQMILTKFPQQLYYEFLRFKISQDLICIFVKITSLGTVTVVSLAPPPAWPERLSPQA